ncbi:MAG: DUF4124 domain-containing protein [Pseudomonadota bacterium]|nr:DUF4124 domain-containing protein [Pseudomonadota bacterium]
MQKTALPFVACLLALAAVGAQAQTLWKWRDAAGQLHISDTAPPAGTPARNIISGPPGGVPVAPVLKTTTQSTTSTTTAADSAASGAETALDKKKRAADKERADKAKADRAAVDAKNLAIRQDNCSRARAGLAGIQSGQRMARFNDKGEREVLDDAGRAEELKRAQELIASNCGAAPAGQ